MNEKRERFERLVMFAVAMALVASFAAVAAHAADGEEPRMSGGPQMIKGATPAIETEPIHNPAGSEMIIAWLSIVPTCDGYIDPAEWADAYMYDISDTTGQHDGIPDPLGTAYLWMKQDETGIYFACRNNADQTLNSYDEFGLFFDDNYDGCFPPSGNTEGNHWLDYQPTGITARWRPWTDPDCGFPPDYVCFAENTGGVYYWTPTCLGIGIGPTGVVDFEVMIPYGAVDEHLDLTMPPDSLGFFVFCMDGVTSTFPGTWPSQSRGNTYREPCYFGTLICEGEEEWPDHKMHFPQLPDEIGWDVNATFPKTLADDWECSETGWVTDIHFWGSWRQGIVVTPMPWFILSIHDNIPASVDTPWSRPGQELWHWEGEVPGTPFDPPTYEGWYDPNTGEWLCNDHTNYWRYDFFVGQNPGADSFFQYEGQIYWLNVSALYIDPPFQWGWKNSRDHFMDDAVYTDNAPDGPWFPIVEPPRCNWFDVYFGPWLTPPEDLGSTNYYGQGWYFYEQSEWWNMWFYNNPFTYENPKHIWLEFWVDFPYPHSWAQFALNWSTDVWSLEGVPDRPPLPADGNEDLFIGREIFPVVEGWNTVDFWIPDYNPEWVSVDFRAEDVMVNGWIYHECVPTSLDLAFVITGVPGEPPVVCGDVNNNGIVDVGDVVYLVAYLYKGGPPPIPMVCVGDVNNNDIVDVGDLVYLVSYLYKGGPPPDPNCCNPPWKK